MHILFVTQQWEPEKGVPQRRARWMIDQLLERGHGVTVVAPPPHYPLGRLTSDKEQDQPGAVSRSPNGEWVYRSSFRPHSHSIISRILDQGVVSASSILKGLKAARGRKFDLVVSTAPPLPAAFTANIIAKRIKAPFLLDLRDAWPELVEHVFDNETASSRLSRAKQSSFSFALRLAAAAFGRIVASADGVITTSNWHCKDLQKRRQSPTTFVPNLVLLDDQISGHESDNRASNGFPKEFAKERPLRVLYTGTVGRAQGLLNAVRSAELAHALGTPIELRIIGGGADLDRLREATSHLDFVELLGPIPRTEVEVHQRWADTLLVHLRDWPPLETTIPSKLFEAIASGKHVTVACNGESQNIIADAGCGDAVPAMNPHALAELWCDLARAPHRLDTGSRGLRWLRREFIRLSPSSTFISFVEGLAHD